MSQGSLNTCHLGRLLLCGRKHSENILKAALSLSRSKEAELGNILVSADCDAKWNFISLNDY